MWEKWDLMTLLIILKDANLGLHLSSRPFKLIPTVRNALKLSSKNEISLP